MKYFYIIIFLIVSCKSTQNIDFIEANTVSVEAVNCPDNGLCSIELITNKSIEFKKDDFDNSYPVITKGDKTLLKYTYIRNSISNVQDSNYTEIIYAELPSKISEISLSNAALQNAKFYFGRLCFCKGETGYYPIKSGDFKITILNKHSLKIDFDFNVSEVPQVTSKIHETVSFKIK